MLSILNGKINNMSAMELARCLKELKLDYRGKKEILRKRLKNYQKQLHLKRADLKPKKGAQTENFDYICVIDFEATCTEASYSDYPHEIIEFPIVLVNGKTKLIECTFQSYVRPVVNPKLSQFCVHLTGITQEQVNQAEVFTEVLKKVHSWLEEKELGSKYSFAVATDGPWDMENFMNLQCAHSGIEFPYWAARWIDIRKIFSNWFNTRRCGIQKMLGYLNLEFEGQQHCGLDDAKNIARILIKLMDDGCPVKLNEKLKNCRTKIERRKPIPSAEHDDPMESESSDDDINFKE